MRLTLRTLLAFMNNALRPEDARTIKKRINQSESAGALLDRTRDVMRRLRLGAPGVMDQKEGLDANTVAEYLDHTLSDERVGDFEEVCFTSDVQLAEVASCHQILAKVLGEPAQVEPKSRRRMYDLHRSVVAERLTDDDADPTPETKDEAPEPTPVMAPSDIEAPAAPPRPPRPPKLPAARYVRREKRNRRILPIVLAMVVVVALGVATLAVLGQFQPGTPLGDLIALSPSDSDVSEDGPSEPMEDADHPAAEDLSPDMSTFPVLSGVEAEPFEQTPDDAPDLFDAAIASEVFAEPAPAGSGFEPMPAETTPPASEPPMPQQPQRIEVGAFSSFEQMLLRLDPQTAAWRRLESPTALFTDDRLMSWPAGEPLFALEGGIQVQLIDGASIVLAPHDKEGIPQLAVDYGRMLIAGSADPDAPADSSRLRLRIGDISGVISFDDPRAVVALEVTRSQDFGSDPELAPQPLFVSLAPWDGPISWRSDANQQPLVIEPMTQVSLTSQPRKAVALERLPDWVSSESDDTFGPSYMDRMASLLIQGAIPPGVPVLDPLRKLTVDRRREVRHLAQRCLSRIGDFEPLLAALSATETTPGSVEELRQAIARGPHTATQVRQAMEIRYGRQGTALYDMFWDFDAAGASVEDLAHLVEYLDHEDLAFRRLAFGNLWAATRQTFDYRPEAPPNQRRTPAERWRDWAQANSLPAERPIQEEAQLPARPGGF